MKTLSEKNNQTKVIFAKRGSIILAVLLLVAYLVMKSKPSDLADPKPESSLPPSSSEREKEQDKAQTANQKTKARTSQQRNKIAALKLSVATVDYLKLLALNDHVAQNTKALKELDQNIASARKGGLGDIHPSMQSMLSDRSTMATQLREAEINARDAILAAVRSIGLEQNWDMIVSNSGTIESQIGKLENRSLLLQAALTDLTDEVRKKLCW
jgi:hypothetical protein